MSTLNVIFEGVITKAKPNCFHNFFFLCTKIGQRILFLKKNSSTRGQVEKRYSRISVA